MKVPKIESVTPQEGHILMITFSDGTQKSYDTTPLPEREVFAPLNNQSSSRMFPSNQMVTLFLGTQK